MSRPMTLEEKVQHYEEVLNKIACWPGDNEPTRLDEPVAAKAAREALAIAGEHVPASNGVQPMMEGARYWHQGYLVMVIRKQLPHDLENNDSFDQR